eukprot:COSAG06_NODE_4966_length_3824_cov_13.185772_4_plen_163_part_00
MLSVSDLPLNGDSRRSIIGLGRDVRSLGASGARHSQRVPGAVLNMILGHPEVSWVGAEVSGFREPVECPVRAKFKMKCPSVRFAPRENFARFRDSVGEHLLYFAACFQSVPQITPKMSAMACGEMVACSSNVLLPGHAYGCCHELSMTGWAVCTVKTGQRAH